MLHINSRDLYFSPKWKTRDFFRILKDPSLLGKLRPVFLVLDALPVVPGVKNQTVKKTNDDSIFYAGTALAELVYSVP